MKLLKLSCDRPTFKTIDFNPDGLTLIVGDGSKDKEEGSSNGVGKSLSLGLIHHCLGAKRINPKLSAAVPDWIFCLDFTIGKDSHCIERSGNGKIIRLDGKKTNYTALRRWLNDKGPFNLGQDVSDLTFRSLMSRFARLQREDCHDPIQTSRETDYAGLLRTSFLLGIDISLILSKKEKKNDFDLIKKTSDNWKKDTVLKDMFNAGSKPEVRVEWLKKELERIKSDLNDFQVAEDYRQIELNAGELTNSLREIEKNQAILRFQIDGINKSLEQHPDISKKDLLDLYEGLAFVFKKEALAHFDAVEEFHLNLSANRKKRLEKDRLELHQEIDQLETKRLASSEKRDSLLNSLQGKRALDEYATLANRYGKFSAELERLNEFLSFAERLNEKKQKIKERLVIEERMATEYAKTKPLTEIDKYFKKIAELLYPNLPSGIVLENNDKDNQIRYDLSVEIEGRDSDGINSARIIIFDWLLLVHGSNHSMNFLWHDNRLFAHIDPQQRARWFKYINGICSSMGKQYIASLNTENYAAMYEYLDKNDIQLLESSIKATLRSDKPENKLLGIQFG